jgi:predicted dehydrogenase
MTENGTVRFGLIGCGDIARKRVAPAIVELSNCELLTVNRGRAELARAFAEEFGARRWHSDWQDAVRDPEIDAVYIATPVYLHAEQAIAAAEAGKHVLCEKPIALNAAEGQKMVDACRANGVRLGVAYYRNFYPVVRRLKEIIASGEIGTVIQAQINVFSPFNPPDDHPRSWVVQRQYSGGGPMYDVGSHRIELLLNLFGPVKRVESLTANVLYPRDVEDTASAVFAFERGATAVLSVSHAIAEGQDRFELYGSTGSVRACFLNQGRLEIETEQGNRVEEHPPHANLHLPLIEDFVNAVLEQREPAVSGETGVAVARINEQIGG